MIIFRLSCCVALMIAACSHSTESIKQTANGKKPLSIVVPIEAKSGSKLKGTATVTEIPIGVRVVLQVAHLTAGNHGAHIHEIGDCSTPDGSSAGPHFNPLKVSHALPPAEQRHLGDLGNIHVAKDGTGSSSIDIVGANLKRDDPNSFLNRAIIIHEKKDDGSQPAGNAGARIGCGKITQ